MAKRMTFEAFTDLTKAQERVGEIAEQLATIRSQRALLESQIKNPTSGPLATMARAVARGESVDHTNGPRAQLAELLERETVLSMGEQLARQAVEELKRLALNEIWANRTVAHKAIAGRVASALEALAKAVAEDQEFRDGCYRESVGWRGPDAFGLHGRTYADSLFVVQSQAERFREYANAPTTSVVASTSEPTSTSKAKPATTTSEATVGELVVD